MNSEQPQSKKRVFHLDLAYAKGWSGGDNCTFETIRHFTKKPVKNIHITTENCRAMYEQKGLTEGSSLQFSTVPDYCKRASGLSFFVAFFRRIIAARSILKQIHWRDDDVVILHNEFFVNTIPGCIPAKKNKKCKIYYWIHMISPDLFKGFDGQFTNSFHLPDPAFVHYWLSQRLCAKLMSSTNGRTISHNPYYAELLPRLFPKCEYDLIYPYSGVDPKFRITAPSNTFTYDCVWLGRFHPQKGLFDLIETMDLIAQKKPDVKLAIIGGGSPEMENKVRSLIQERKLETNVTLLGSQFDADKYAVLSKSKIYLMTSHFEGYCNVMVEALTMGLPVVAFDAPFHQVFDRGVVKVPMQNTTALAEKTIDLLNDELMRKKLAHDAFNAGNKHTWDYVAEETYKIACTEHTVDT